MSSCVVSNLFFIVCCWYAFWNSDVVHFIVLLKHCFLYSLTLLYFVVVIKLFTDKYCIIRCGLNSRLDEIMTTLCNILKINVTLNTRYRCMFFCLTSDLLLLDWHLCQCRGSSLCHSVRSSCDKRHQRHHDHCCCEEILLFTTVDSLIPLWQLID